MVGLDHAIFRVHGRAFDQRQQIALHAGARDVGAAMLGARSDLVDLVQEHDAVLFDVLDRLLLHLVFIDELGGFLVDQDLHRVLDLHLARLLASAADAGKHRLDLFRHFFHARRRHDFHLGRGLGHVDLDFLVVERTLAQALAEGLARDVAILGIARADVEAEVARRRHQDVDHAVLGRVLGALAILFHFAGAGLLDADVDQVADDGIDIAPDVADFGELGRFDLDKRCVGQLGQAARDLGLADAGRADHQDVLRRDLLAQRLGDLQAAPAVTQRDRHRTLRSSLPDDVLVQLVDDFLRRHRAEPAHSSTSIVR